jgi:hypothetical protein
LGRNRSFLCWAGRTPSPYRAPSSLPTSWPLLLLARWNSTLRHAGIGEIRGRLDEAGITYTLTEVEAGELVCLSEDVTGG